MSLAKYIREVALLTGTKVSCGEGGCGACMVTVSKFDGDTPRSVNSVCQDTFESVFLLISYCLSPVMICDGWSITTVEGLGGKGVGYHPIQTALAATGGTQCGYCSPGMVMQLHSYLQEHPDATVKEIDNILDGNICRFCRIWFVNTNFTEIYFLDAQATGQSWMLSRSLVLMLLKSFPTSLPT